MNLYALNPQQLLSINEIDADLINKYHLTLPSYYVYQLIYLEYINAPSIDHTSLIETLFTKKEENDDFRHGVIDAFCEIVKAGVKKIAFSHATSDLNLFASDLRHAYACAKKYDIQFYIEENLIETSLFKNSGSYVYIFYSNPQDIQDYLSLKEAILENKNPTLEDKIAYGQELGRLLSYSEQRINEMINSNLHNFL